MTTENLPAVRSVIIARADMLRFHETMLAEARAGAEDRHGELEQAHHRLQFLESGDGNDQERASDLAEHVGLPEQAERYKSHHTNNIGVARRLVTRLTKRVDEADRYLRALETGHVPMPRMAAVRLEYAMGLIPVEAMESLDEAQNSGLFDEYRVIDGREATDWGYPNDRRAPRYRDPILVGMIGHEMFPLAWWR